MEENQKKKSNVGGFAVGLTIICILGLAIMGFFIYYLLNARESDNERMQALRNDITTLKSSMLQVNAKVNENGNGKEAVEEAKVSYIVLSVEDTASTEGLKEKTKQITDENEIKAVLDILEEAEEYTLTKEVMDFSDITPGVVLHYTDGKTVTVSAIDAFDDEGNTVNLILKWEKEDQSDKKLFKIETELGEYITTLFNK